MFSPCNSFSDGNQSFDQFGITTVVQKIDFCELAANGNNMPILFKLFLPQLLDIVVLPMCSIVGRHEMNFTMTKVPADPTFVGLGDYRLDMEFFAESGVYLWWVLTYIKVGEDK
jgi:hypothetical protein